MARNRRLSAGRDPRTVWAGAGVALLTIVVIVLSFVALTQNRSVAEAGSTPRVSTPASDIAQTPTEPEPETPPPAPQPVAVPTRVIAAIDGDSAVRAATTACPTPSTIEVTEDAGATWEPFEAASIANVQRITAGTDAFIALIGLGVEGCAPSYERSFTGGVAWEPAPDELSASWFVDPANRAGLHAPAGDRAAPCGAVVQIAVIDESSAAVLCDDSSVHATTDGGATWLQSGPIAGAAAIGAGGAGYRVAVINANGCVGAQLVELTVVGTGLTPGTPGACLTAAVALGEVAVESADGGTTWLWAGDVVGRTEDGGASWL